MRAMSSSIPFPRCPIIGCRMASRIDCRTSVGPGRKNRPNADLVVADGVLVAALALEFTVMRCVIELRSDTRERRTKRDTTLECLTMRRVNKLAHVQHQRKKRGQRHRAHDDIRGANDVGTFDDARE